MIRTLLLLVIISLQTTASSALSRQPRGSRGVSRSSSNRRHLDERGDVKKPKKRECKISEKPEEIKFKCKAKANSEDGSKIKDEIKFGVKNDNKKGLKVKVEYEHKIKAQETETESETQYDIIFDKVVEYQKGSNESSSEAYDWENDKVVQEFSLLNLGSFSEIVDDEEGVVSTFSISTLDNIATFTFHISRADNGEGISANKMKIDFELKSFQWAQSDTYVALICNVESKEKVAIEYDEEDDDVEARPTTGGKRSKKTRDVIINFQDAIEGTGITPFGVYTWDDSAMVIDPNATDTTVFENVTISVVATSPLDTASDSIAFSFIGDAAKSADDIYWDPTTGINYASNSVQAALSSIGIMVGAVCTFMTLV